MLRTNRIFVAALLAGGLGASACLAGSVAEAATPIKYGGTLRVVMPWGSIVDDFNPLAWAGGTSTTAGGTGSLLYEPLFYDNPYTGNVTPLLGTSYKWEDNNLELVVTTRSGVTWSDGQPFSAKDVAFTFNYIKKYPALDPEGFWQGPLASVTATEPNTVVFKFNKADTPIFPLLVEQEIVPQHIWASITDPMKFTNPHPVGTGPFLLKSYTPLMVTYVRNPHYWMKGEPYVDEVTMQAVKSNNTAELLLLNGQADYTYDAITDPNKTFVAANPKYNHYWWPGFQLNLLYFNTATAPFNSLALRRAVAQALNTSLIAERAYFGSLPPANETAVTEGQVSEWVPSYLKSLMWKYDPAQAVSTLTKAGYKISGGQLYLPNGKPLGTVNLLIGGPGWTDYISMAQTIAEELKAIGINVNVEQETYSTYYSNLETGHYQMAISWSNDNFGTPYNEYEALLSPSASAPIGKVATTNFERFTNPTIEAALQSFATTTNTAVQHQDMVAIERQVLENVPVVALTARPNWFDYTTRDFVGWPGPNDPYNAGEPPDAYGGGAELLYLHLHLAPWASPSA